MIRSRLSYNATLHVFTVHFTFPMELLFTHKVLLVTWFHLKVRKQKNRKHVDVKRNIKRTVNETEK